MGVQMKKNTEKKEYGEWANIPVDNPQKREKNKKIIDTWEEL